MGWSNKGSTWSTSSCVSFSVLRLACIKRIRQGAETNSVFINRVLITVAKYGLQDTSHGGKQLIIRWWAPNNWEIKQLVLKKLELFNISIINKQEKKYLWLLMFFSYLKSKTSVTDQYDTKKENQMRNVHLSVNDLLRLLFVV